MDFFTACTLLDLFLVLFFSSSLEATTIGFSARLLPLTSPKHPSYNPHATREDIISHKLRISANRQRYFAHMGQSFQNGPPIESVTVVAYSIGSPPVESLGFFDTGSSLIWLQCQPCMKCYNQTKPIFDPKRSSTYQKVQCQKPAGCSERRLFSCNSASNTCKFHIGYVDGTYSQGDVAIDTISFPENEYSPKLNLPNTLFGCGFNNFDKFSSGYGGIVGLQNTTISLIGQANIDSFSYCNSEDGGYIRFGSLSTLVGVKTTLFTSHVSHLYHVNLRDIAVDNKRLGIRSSIFKIVKDRPDSGVIIDSGTAYTFLHPVAMAAVINRIRDTTVYVPSQTEDWILCYNVNKNEGLTLEKLPSIKFILDQNTTISLPKENVWTQKNKNGNICLKILRSRNLKSIIGSEQLANYNVGYDIKRNALWLDYQLGCEF